MSSAALGNMKRRRQAVKRLADAPCEGHKKRQFPSCAAIAREGALRDWFHTSASTVRRDLRALGYCARKRQRGPTRVEGDEIRRLRFCREHCNSKDDILFSDEKYFDVNDHSSPWQWCKRHEMPQRRETSRWAPKVHVWGLIGRGVKELVLLPTGMINQHLYKLHCLQRVLIPTLMHLNNEPRFMQDGARAHTAFSTLRYLASKNVKVIENWPPRSPDLNPIEHLWARLQRDVSDRGPHDEDDLKMFILECWRAVPQCEIDSLVSTFGQRCENVVFDRGL